MVCAVCLSIFLYWIDKVMPIKGDIKFWGYIAESLFVERGTVD